MLEDIFGMVKHEDRPREARAVLRPEHGLNVSGVGLKHRADNLSGALGLDCQARRSAK
jgi:hypothetical protein